MHQTLLTHPDNLPVLEAAFCEVCDPSPLKIEPNFLLRDIGFMAGITIQPSPHLPRFVKKWVPPKGRFWEFESSDTWAEKLGFGHYEDDPTQPYIIVIKEPPRTRFNPYLSVPKLPMDWLYA